MPYCYDNRSIDARAITMFGADARSRRRHCPSVLTSSELLAALRRLKEEGTTSNAKLSRLLGLPSPRVAEIFDEKRRITIDEMKVLVEHFALMPETEARVVVASPEPVDSIPMVGIQQIDLAYGMGATFTDSPVEVEVLHFPRTWVETITYSPPELLTWARGRGDSMSPTIYDGDLLMIDRSQKKVKEQDAIWAFAVGDVGSVKRLRVKGDRYVILSDNPSVPDDEEPQDFVTIVGRVVFVGAKK